MNRDPMLAWSVECDTLDSLHLGRTTRDMTWHCVLRKVSLRAWERTSAFHAGRGAARRRSHSMVPGGAIVKTPPTRACAALVPDDDPLRPTRGEPRLDARCEIAMDDDRVVLDHRAAAEGAAEL